MDRLHIIHGFWGIVVGFLPFPVLWLLAYVCLPKATNFNLDPLGQPGTFDSFLAKYLRLGEFVVGIAASSIVLLVGSSTLRTASVGIPRFYSSPLFVLCWCVLWGIFFMAWLLYHYEDYLHGAKHTTLKYSLSLALGFSSLVCFVLGYAWLIYGIASVQVSPT